MSNKKLIAIFTPIMSVIAVLIAAITVASSIFADTISLFLYGVGDSQISEETLNAGAALTEDIVKEGTVLLKNEDDALPLSDEEIQAVNVFGWAAYDWMTSTFGSGFSNTSLEKIKLFPALEEAGIEYNKDLYDMYKAFYSSSVNEWGMTLDEYRGDVAVGTDAKFILHEPGEGFYTDDVINYAHSFSDVALVVIGRTGGEAADLRKTQTKQVQTNGATGTTVDSTRTYLQLSTEEEQMIAAAKKACSKVIVLLNTSNTMELGFIDDPEIDAAMLVGLTGLTGVRSVIDLLRGEDADGNPVNPSGRTADTYAYDISTAPSTVNSGYGGAVKYTDLPTSGDYKKGYYDAYVDYYEGIYVGYRWYETAAEEGYINYGETVQYPFGYGLSYTSFEWSVDRVLINGTEQDYDGAVELGKNDEITIEVTVTNTGDIAGKDVVELYYSAPYTKGGIEKSSVVLGDFVKTGIIQPGGTDSVVLTLSVQSMASYDPYDGAGGLPGNNNGHTGYELDGGEYTLKLMKNSHELAVMGVDSVTDAAIAYTVPAGGYNYDTDGQTEATVENRLTGSNTIDGYPIDGSEETTPVKYLSRADFAATFPAEKILRGRSGKAYDVARAQAPTAEQLAATGYTNVSMPLTGNNQGFILDDMLDVEGYGDEYWDILIHQMTTTELFDIIRDGYFKTQAIGSIGKPIFIDLDGPLGLNTRVTSNASCKFVSYPSETLLAQTWNPDLAYAMGMSVGTEARESEVGIRGWYGPAANIHRNPYGGRNAEYYSEDGLLSGRFAAETVRGAKNAGIYCYIKHFVANDSESLREGLYTFMTEQTLREIYLKPFEVAVKEGGANALMTSMNRVGATWVGGSRAICTDILRGEWGFNGTLVTDWVDTGTDYMPLVKGIWAGNDIWLNNVEANQVFSNAIYNYSGDAVVVTLAQKVARDVLWTLVDTEQVRSQYDPDADTAGSVTSGGYEYNRSWVWWGVVPACGVLLAVEGVLVFFLIKKIRRNNANKVAQTQSAETQTE